MKKNSTYTLLVEVMNHLDFLSDLCQSIGDDLLNIQSTDIQVTKKDDDSPVTQADLLAHNRIIAALQELCPDLPIISEEMSSDERHNFSSRPEHYWLLDPLDGTQEFIRHSPDFTINIARMHHNEPVLSIIHAPAHGRTFAAARGWGCFQRQSDDSWLPIEPKSTSQKSISIIHSHRDTQDKLEEMLHALPSGTLRAVGSSLKFCLIACGEGHVYLRRGTTMEWDTAAGQLIVTESGGSVLTGTEEPLTYGRSSFENPNFVAIHPSCLQFEAELLALIKA